MSWISNAFSGETKKQQEGYSCKKLKAWSKRADGLLVHVILLIASWGAFLLLVAIIGGKSSQEAGIFLFSLAKVATTGVFLYTVVVVIFALQFIGKKLSRSDRKLSVKEKNDTLRDVAHSTSCHEQYIVPSGRIEKVARELAADSMISIVEEFNSYGGYRLICSITEQGLKLLENGGYTASAQTIMLS